MADTYVQLRIHLVWSTRNRQDFLEEGLRERLWSYIGGIIRHNKGVVFAIGGTFDHVHIYCEYPKTTSLAQFVSKIKSNSSKWLRETYPELDLFHWQSGYGAFTVGRRGDERLTEYIRNQELHHLTMTFEEEYLRLLNAHRIIFDPRYVLTG